MLTESRGPAMVGLQFRELLLFDEYIHNTHVENVFCPQSHPSCIQGIFVEHLLSPCLPFSIRRLLSLHLNFAVILLDLKIMDKIQISFCFELNLE